MQPTSAPEEQRKACSRCKEVKHFSEFNRKASAHDGLRYECKACQANERARYYAENRGAEREHAARYYVVGLPVHRKETMLKNAVAGRRAQQARHSSDPEAMRQEREYMAARRLRVKALGSASRQRCAGAECTSRAAKWTLATADCVLESPRGDYSHDHSDYVALCNAHHLRLKHALKREKEQRVSA